MTLDCIMGTKFVCHDWLLDTGRVVKSEGEFWIDRTLFQQIVTASPDQAHALLCGAKFLDLDAVNRFV